MFKLDVRGKKVLFISDTHIPYSVAGYIRFLENLKHTFQPDVVIHGGDEVDYHAISFHKSDQDLLSAGHELKKAIEEIQEGLHRIFPKLYLLDSNHGSLVTRRMKHEGIPVELIKPRKEVYKTPDWSWHDSILLQTDQGWVYATHGKSGAYKKMVRELGVSVVQFHFHTMFEIVYHRTVTGSKFQMFCSCLADRDSLAMAYAKNNVPEFINGTGGLHANGEPVLFPYYDDWNSFPPLFPSGELLQ